MPPSLSHLRPLWQPFSAGWHRFWLSRSPFYALVETWALTFLLLLVIDRLSQPLTSFTLANMIFFSSCLAGAWLALRIRLDRGQRWQRLIMGETLTGLAQGGLAVGGVLLPFWLLLHTTLFDKSALGPFGAALYLAGSGAAYLGVRGAVWVLSFWDHLRRRSLMWSLTHAHLSVVMISAGLGVLALLAFNLFFNPMPETYQQMGPGPRFVSRLLTSILPILAVYGVMVFVALGILLPPSALFSFLFARRTTQRLKKVVEAAHRFRAGDYRARTPVEGEDEVAQLQADFNGMAGTLETTLQTLQTEQARVKDLLQSRRELVASVSHELRTPVATLRGYLDAALDGSTVDGDPLQDSDPLLHSGPLPRSDRLRADLEIMRRETIRLQGLIDDLFTLSRAEAHGLSLEQKAVDLNPLICERVAAVAPLAWQSARVEVLCDLPANLPPVLADPVRLDQVLTNLLRNAIRYTPPGGIVAVTAVVESASPEGVRPHGDLSEGDHPGGARLRLDVRDTGQGIPAEDLPRIWERFYRGAGNDSVSGAGLGLALVKELTEAMGGAVGVESKVGEGSCFTIWLRVSA